MKAFLHMYRKGGTRNIEAEWFHKLRERLGFVKRKFCKPVSCLSIRGLCIFAINPLAISERLPDRENNKSNRRETQNSVKSGHIVKPEGYSGPKSITCTMCTSHVQWKVMILTIWWRAIKLFSSVV